MRGRVKGIMSSPRIAHALALLFLAALTLVMFGDLLFSRDDRILSHEGLDLSRQFIFWRDFGFSELARGNLPLWNPHIFSGAPFLGGFQSALLYPPNLLFLVLPLPQAINISISLHFFLLGFFMYLWTACRGLNTLACFLSSIIVMFSGPFFLHIYAGHLSNLCAMTWLPLILLAIDGIGQRPSPGWVLTGIFALTMQVLAGHPQYVYYTGITAAIYSCLLFPGAIRKKEFVLSLLVLLLGAGALSALQILCGWQAARESVRSLGLSFQVASMFSLPPENLLTWFSPRLFGDMINFPYWGRWYLWEMSLFMSITGFVLAIYGLGWGKGKQKRFAATMTLLLLVLALGVYTPLFAFLYNWLPGFDRFRGTAKFGFPATLFFAMLAGIGLDTLLRQRQVPKAFACSLLAIGIILALGALAIHFSSLNQGSSAIWQQLLRFPALGGESYLPRSTWLDPSFPGAAALFAARDVFLAAGIFTIAALLFFLPAYSRLPQYLLVLLAFLELLNFASQTKASFSLAVAVNPELTGFYRSHPGDYRVLNLLSPNSAMSQAAGDIWGYDQGVPLRYAQFIAFTQGANPDQVTQYINFQRYHPLFRMLRCRYVIMPRDKGIFVQEMADTLPRLLLVQDWQTLAGRNDIFQQMARDTFDPRRTVLLEGLPLPKPEQGDGEKAVGSIAIEEETTDHLRLRGRLDRAAILLITDSYSSGWRARALPGSGQQDYRVMPANYTLMAIPLTAGEHQLVLEYRPRAFLVGRWISLLGLALYIVFSIWYLIRMRRRGRYKTGASQ